MPTVLLWVTPSFQWDHLWGGKSLPMMNDDCKIYPSPKYDNIQMLMCLEQISDSPSSSAMYKLQ